MSQPNILVIMVDQLNGTLFPDGPAEWLHTPNLKALAAKSTRFQNALYRLAVVHAITGEFHDWAVAFTHQSL